MSQYNFTNSNAPLADRLRPRTLDEFVGQEKIIGAGKILRLAVERDRVPSIIFWGPPGCGKTTLARIIANLTQAEFVPLSAVSSGVKDIRREVEAAAKRLKEGKKTIIFIDEIHRFNKGQQDALLPHVERGIITLIGATTENPSFEVISALLSRCRVFVLEKLTAAHIKKLAERALTKEPALRSIKIAPDALQYLAEMSDGDARVALNALELAAQTSPPIPLLAKERGVIDKKIIEEALQKSLLYDKTGEEHYNIISALHKSMRGGDADAALYWLARMLEGGEAPLYIARRLIRFASEDIGIANSLALPQAVAAYQACHYIGMPECSVNLAQAVVYMAKSKKSNELYVAYGKAAADVKQYGALPVPLHIRNAPTKLMKELNYGKGYKYSPEYDYREEQECLPPEIKNHKYLDDI
ncbi:AAA family ATPase [Candidatus Falkowbacteria bacterium RIFCSPLOWO2_02_FULL_45_15]|uniref:AAA family ATPase n=2 Tax=Candidatus Falkowiibacteriota TaxID=1752728 RepID=A0A1F5RZD1_9BACT|nr:MAG: AAA family ATPase [Candidatus Falkowbacteria bacterium RIFCSPHIGHO2_02_FULL_45_15]OGF20211.1 MAG: AAA family ATPase [Candidatus Falkowbacteria bacterium RIFCSPLOWO2_02_FULL_45_15]